MRGVLGSRISVSVGDVWERVYEYLAFTTADGLKACVMIARKFLAIYQVEPSDNLHPVLVASVWLGLFTVYLLVFCLGRMILTFLRGWIKV